MIRKFKIKNLKFKINPNGFSLLETLLYLSLLTILVGGIVTFMYTMIEANIKVKTISTANDEASHTLTLMTQYIRNAQSVNSLSVDTLSLNTFDTPNSPAVFSLVNNTIVLSLGGNGIVALTSPAVKVSNLTFTNVAVPNSKNLIKISFKMNSQTTSIKQEYNYEKTYEITTSVRN